MTGVGWEVMNSFNLSFHAVTRVIDDDDHDALDDGFASFSTTAA
jgi:hypothetical protein